MKDWYKSKTLWFNVAYLVLLIVDAVLAYFGYGSFEPSPELVIIGAGVVALVNMILRYFFTNTALQ